MNYMHLHVVAVILTLWTKGVEGCCAPQFNIERGYKMDGIIAELLKEDAQEPLDIIALQEVDIGCERSAGEDTGMHAFIYVPSSILL